VENNDIFVVLQTLVFVLYENVATSLIKNKIYIVLELQYLNFKNP